MEFNSEVKKATNSIYKKISDIMPEIEWSTHAPYIYEINKLKKEKNTVYLLTTIKLQKFIMVYQIFQPDSLALLLKRQKQKLIL